MKKERKERKDEKGCFECAHVAVWWDIGCGVWSTRRMDAPRWRKWMGGREWNSWPGKQRPPKDAPFTRNELCTNLPFGIEIKLK